MHRDCTLQTTYSIIERIFECRRLSLTSMDPMQNEKEDKEEGPVVKDLQMNWEHLRKLSLMAGGFGEDRTRAWYVALRVTYPWTTYPL